MSLIPLKEIFEDPDFIESLEFHSKHFNHLSTIESLIIRGHILIEHDLNEAIKKCVLYKEKYKADKFSFSQKIAIGSMLGITQYIEQEVQLINKLRNQIAHSLTYEKDLLKILFSKVDKMDKLFHLKNDDNEKTKRSISWICGMITISPYTLQEIQYLTIKKNKLQASINKLKTIKEKNKLE